jgi:hypothetical protein
MIVEDALGARLHLRPRARCVFARGVRNGPRREIVSKRVGSAYWSGNCRNWTKAKNPSCARLALHEKRGVNSGPAESISFRTGQKLQRERLFFAMAADADTTSVDVLGRANSGASGGNCHSWAEGNKLTSGHAAALACTLRSLGPKLSQRR